MWTIALCISRRPLAEFSSGRYGTSLRASAKAGGMLWVATSCRISPSQRLMAPLAASLIRTALARMVSKTRSRSPVELAMTRSTSEVAFCSSDASSTSRLSCAIFAAGLGEEERRRCAGFGARPRFGAVLRRRGLSPALECRRIASPEAQDRHRSESNRPSGSAWLSGRSHRRHQGLRQPFRQGSQNPFMTLLVRGDDALRASHDLTASLGPFTQLQLYRRQRAFRRGPGKVRKLIAKPRCLPLGVSAGIALAALDRPGKGNLAVEMANEPRHAVRLHRRQIGIET